jgi:RNA polymerase sigma-70 factor (ECF subfamily)
VDRRDDLNYLDGRAAQRKNGVMFEGSSFDDVMAQLRAGDDDAAAQVFHRFADRLIALARSRLDGQLRAKVDPEDVLQSVYKSFFVRYAAGQLDPLDWDGLWTLLTVITLRKCGRWRQRFQTGKRCVNAEVSLQMPASASGSGWQPPGHEPTPAEAAMLTETVEDLLRGLEGRDRSIATLALQGHSAREISTQLNRPERTVFRVLARIKSRLQRLRDADCG